MARPDERGNVHNWRCRPSSVLHSGSGSLAATHHDGRIIDTFDPR